MQRDLLERELVWSVMYYIQENPETFDYSLARKIRVGWRLCMPSNQEDLYVFNDYTYRTYDFFYESFESGSHSYTRPLQYISFKSFRHLGFAIWSAERLHKYGLLWEFGPDDTPKPSYEVVIGGVFSELMYLQKLTD